MYENKKIIIYNYNKLNQINDENISVDEYYIKGDDLKIKELDGYQVIISGIIKEISYDEIHH